MIFLQSREWGNSVSLTAFQGPTKKGKIMPIYEVFATKEVNYHVINIEANSEAEAIQKVQQAYDSNTLSDEHILNIEFFLEGANEERVDY